MTKATDTPVAFVSQVVISNLTMRGDGSEANPLRRVVQVFQLDGTLIAERDPINERQPDSVVQFPGGDR